MTVKYTTDESVLRKELRLAWFQDLGEFDDVYEIETRKRKVDIDRPFQIGIAVYQMTKLGVLQFYYNCLDKVLDRRDFELIQMDSDSLYFALSCDWLEEAVRPELREEFQKCQKKNGLVGTNGLNTNPGCLSSSLRALA